RGIRNDGEVGRARHLVEAHAAAAGERGEGAGTGGIERGGGDVDVVAGLERGNEGRHRHRLGARGAMRIGPGESDELQVLPRATALDLLGLPPLLVAPEAMSFDKSEGLGHLHHSIRGGKARTVDEGTTAIQVVKGNMIRHSLRLAFINWKKY